jgi:hypothetical protein
VEEIRRREEAKVFGKAQSSSNTPTHASTSARIAAEASKKVGVESAHMNRSLRTVTGNSGAPNIRPDVTVVNNNGTIDMHEVRSAGQTTGELVNKLTEARSGLGVSGRNIVVEPDPMPSVGVKGGTIGAFGVLGVVQMVFHEYVEHKVAERAQEQQQQKIEQGLCGPPQCT